MQVSSSLNMYSSSVNRPSPLPEVIQPVETPSLKENDEARKAVVAYAGYQSKVNQLEIYIQGSTGESVELSHSTQTLMQGYMDAKKTNDAINAYS